MKIDVHTHVVPEHFPKYTGMDRTPAWPVMENAHACHKHVMVSGKRFRTVAHDCWDCAVRAKAMGAMGVDHQVLSPMPELLSYWFNKEDGCNITRFMNDFIAALVQEAPDRFTGLGCVPLQDIGSAIKAIDEIKSNGILKGIEIGGSVNGMSIGHPHFRPFFEAVQEANLSIFVHPIRPAGADRLVGHPALEQVLAFPAETGLAAASLITGGTFNQLPKLRIAFSHGGGSFGMLLPRLQSVWEKNQEIRETISHSPLELARKMFYDTLVYDKKVLQYIENLFGIDSLLMGTDYPFPIMERQPVDFIRRALQNENKIHSVLSANALRWLGI